jgi:hypothetical protein
MPPHKVLPGVGSCVDCLAWGVVGARRCSSCTMLRHCYPGGDGECAGCGRVLALKRGHCRLCWQQAAYESKTVGGLPRGAVSVLESGRPLRYHQLFFDRMKLRRPESPARKYGQAARYATQAAAGPGRTAAVPVGPAKAVRGPPGLHSF